MHVTDLALMRDGSSSGLGDIGLALEQIISTQCLPPRCVRRIDCASDLPTRLQHLLCIVGAKPIWRAFTDGAQWWFGLAFERAAPLGEPGLEFDAFFLCQNALLWAGGRWACTRNAELVLREIYDLTAAEPEGAHERILRLP